MKRFLAILLAVVMIFSLAACGQQAAPSEPVETVVEEPVDPDTLPAVETWEYDTAKYYDDSAVVYEGVLGEYYEYYQKALAATNVSERYALEAIAEAKLLNSAIMLPTTTQGGNYAISRVVPKTINSTLWGNDSDRFHDALVATEFIKPADRNEIKPSGPSSPAPAPSWTGPRNSLPRRAMS